MESCDRCPCNEDLIVTNLISKHYNKQKIENYFHYYTTNQYELLNSGFFVLFLAARGRGRFTRKLLIRSTYLKSVLNDNQRTSQSVIVCVIITSFNTIAAATPSCLVIIKFAPINLILLLVYLIVSNYLTDPV